MDFPAVYMVNREEFEPLLVTPHCVFISSKADRALALEYSDCVLLLPEVQAIEVGIQTFLETNQPVIVIGNQSLEVFVNGSVRKISKDKNADSTRHQ